MNKNERGLQMAPQFEEEEEDIGLIETVKASIQPTRFASPIQLTHHSRTSPSLPYESRPHRPLNARI
jgi:hypothetical protein